MHLVGKRYAIGIEAEKTTFEQRDKYRYIQKTTTLIIAAFAVMDGQRQFVRDAENLDFVYD